MGAVSAERINRLRNGTTSSGEFDFDELAESLAVNTEVSLTKARKLVAAYKRALDKVLQVGDELGFSPESLSLSRSLGRQQKALISAGYGYVVKKRAPGHFTVRTQRRRAGRSVKHTK